MQLSTNFTLAELTVTGTGLRNVPNQQQIACLQALVTNVLQPLRDKWGKPIHLTSGFRTKAVNNAVRGSKTSQHMKGEAADIECSDNAALYRLICDFLPFDQLIWEGGDDKQPAWVHVSYSTVHNRKQVLRLH